MNRTMRKLVTVVMVLALMLSMVTSAFAVEVPSNAFKLPAVKERVEEEKAPSGGNAPAEEKPAEKPVEEPSKEPAEKPVEEPAGEPTVEEPTVETPVEKEQEVAVDKPAEQPAEETEDQPAEEVVEEPAADAVGKATVSLQDGNLNVRAEGKSDGKLLDKIANGESVTILTSENGWTKIRTSSGLEGWVASSYLKIEEEAPAEEAPAETPVEEPAAEEAPAETPVEETTEEEVLEEELPEEVVEEEPAEPEIDVSKLRVEIASSLNGVVLPGETVTLTANMIGFDGLEYSVQWQSNDGSGWSDVSGATDLSYSYSANENNINYEWRLMVNL